MDLMLERLSVADTRLEVLARIQADLSAQILEWTELREQLWEAQVLADLQNETRARRPAPAVMAAIA
jgi:hypothetical protein